MAISYADGLSIIQRTASKFSARRVEDSESVPILRASGRIAFGNVYSPVQTPTADTSAMDGFAVVSSTAADASTAEPVVLSVEGIVAAGDTSVQMLECQDAGLNHASLEVSNEGLDRAHRFPPCVEIMTGARFPPSFLEGGKEWVFDACLRLEDATPLAVASPDQPRLIQITKPVAKYRHRRSAGEDFSRGDLVLRKGQTLEPKHVMALASLGVREVAVFRKLQVGVFSTGDEVVPLDDPSEEVQVRDANGPFLKTMLEELGAEVHFWGVVRDNSSDYMAAVERHMQKQKVDILISTGAVSLGRFDFIEEAVRQLGGEVKFHHAAVRPGHPVLFGVVPLRCGSESQIDPTDGSGRELRRTCASVAYFGLPGNPVAAVACLRFFVVPYLQYMHGLAQELGVFRTLMPHGSKSGHMSAEVLAQSCPFDTFRLGSQSDDGRTVEVVPSQASHKIRPLLEADCWLVFPANQPGVEGGGMVRTVPLFPHRLDSP